MPTAPDSRAFASWLATQTDLALAELFAEREASPSASWQDFFDVAEDLHDPTSVGRALAGLPRGDAEALIRAAGGEIVPEGAQRQRLTVRGLIDADGAAYRAVAEVVRERAAAISPDPSSTSADATTTDAAAPTDSDADSAGALTRNATTDAAAPADTDGESAAATAERAFSSSAALADVLQAALRTPLTRIGTGALGAADRRRLVESGAAATAEDADEAVAVASAAGLAVPQGRTWLITAAGAAWMRSGTLERWSTVARRLRDALPEGLRSDDGGWIAPSEWPAAFPFDPTWPAQSAEWLEHFRHWGVIGPDGAPAPWSAGLAAGADVDVDALQELLPHEVDRVYLQNDLTAIAPGPLAPQLDMRLRTMTVRESRAQASTYRFTAESIGAAITAGETADSLRAFLTTLSLTGVPQPLAYEIERTAARHGLVQLRWDAASERTRLRSDDPAVLKTIAVDQALRPLGLVTEGGELTSRSTAETVFWMLADARYPVVALDEEGAPRTVERWRVAPAPAPEPAPLERFGPLLARLRAAHDTDAESAWLGRELDVAVRTHSLLAVVVRLPDGSTREFTLEATGLGGGRLRGRDRAADIERTLPVSSIESIRPLS